MRFNLISSIRLRFIPLAILMLGVVAFSPHRCVWGEEPAVKPEQKPKAEAVENPFPKRNPAPELNGGVEWLNSAGPISMKDLRGKIVLIDFWTFCCINCMHVLPDLAYLEKKFPNELVVVGVHSAKFDNERETGNIRKAILRYEIQHPVVNDAQMTIWRKFGVNSWPSLVVVDPEGQYCGYVSGEGNRELLEKVVERLIEYHESKGTLDRTPIRFDLERNKSKPTALRFPGKLLVDEAKGRLFVSDSNNNRIVVCSLDGQLLDVIGSGVIGQVDGDYANAQFDHPQGLALVDQTLFVADTENHLLRSIDLAAKKVSKFAGTGEQNRMRARGGTLLESPLNSPWDLTVVDGVLYIAMAGPHQIWAHKLGTNTIQPYAGSGREDIVNGELDHAALAQPSGIVHDQKELYVVDSEGSAVRKITTDPKNDLKVPSGTVTTIAGTHDLPRGRSLFEFGDVDGTGDDARFQHPLGLAIDHGSLYVADSYNHKIRRVDLKTREVSTWAGTGHSGSELATLELSEPAGLAIANGKMYVADTNNHRIVVIDMATKKANELSITELTAPNPAIEAQADGSDKTPRSDVVRQELSSGDAIQFEVQFDLPEGFKLNELFPIAFRCKAEGDQSLLTPEQQDQKYLAKIDGDNVKLTLPIAKKTGETTLEVALTFGYCRDQNGGVCKVGTTKWKVPVLLKDGAKETTVRLKAKGR